MSSSSHETIDLLSKILVLVVLVHNSTVFIFHFASILKGNINQKRNRLVNLSILSTLCMTTFQSIHVINYYSMIHSHITCKFLMYFLWIFYVLSKFTLYTFFLERLFVAFEHSIVAFTTRQVMASRLVLISYIICPIIFVF
eukprot:549671_1